ncbi:hypothetical protein BST22_01000 [Mycolicibacterium chubuense]|uniref:Uncharacterized protein n=1 Tax=Mycolicibacterium chubuense TaxID=1800 RepID=A0A0J6V7U1_MYCCU|nr:hypothetical protein MCHUDSM44219_05690 [Mycolicibacterium chubuense]ORA56547.1 hypothetical protein BST22_01000 [Mycolicibacterium chubuense]SPX99020.1 Uncharacterised protein [Mycolicibacterium chubuense]
MTTPPPGQWPPPPQGSPQGPPQWNPQPGPPPQGGNKAKWILGGLALLVVVVVTVVATLLVTRGSSGSTTPTASAPPSTSVDTSDIASASDRGPISLITEEPTCQRWTTTSAGLAHAATNGWDKRDPSISEAQWSPEQRRQYEAMAAAIRQAADEAARLARETPHRVVRVLYEQFIAYGRSYVEHIPQYAPPDDQIVRVSNSVVATLNAICDSIAFGSASARAPLVPEAAAPRDLPSRIDPNSPERFLRSQSPVCAEWLASAEKFTNDTAAWRSVDPNIAASALSPEQRAINNAAMPIMEAFATESQRLGRKSDNPVWADIATLSAQYRRAYVSALPTYAAADNDLQVAAGSAVGAISEACRAAEN